MRPSTRAAIHGGAALLLLIFAGLLHAATPRRHIMYLRADQGVLDHRLATFPTGAAQQMQTLEHQFEQIGLGKGICSHPTTPVGLVCTVPGQTPSVVLVLAFLPRNDKHRETHVDDAPLVLLPLLAESAVGVERKSTYLFAIIESDGNEAAALQSLIDGIQGAGQRTVSAVLLLSQLGRAQPIVGCVKRGSLLERAWAGTASTMNVQDIAEDVSPCPGTLKRLDTTLADRRVLITSPGSIRAPNPAGFGQIVKELEQLDPKAYYVTYQYLCTFLAYLDTSLDTPAGPHGATVDESIAAELKGCFEQARASRGLPAFSSSASLAAFARQRAARLADNGDAASSQPQDVLDRELQESGFLAASASESSNSVAMSERGRLCDTLVTNRLVASPGPVALALSAQVRGERIFAVAELAIPAATIAPEELKRQVVEQIGTARHSIGKSPMQVTERPYMDSLACEVNGMEEPSLAPVLTRLRREHMTAHSVVYRGRTPAIPEDQLATLRDSKDDEVSVGTCRSPGSGEATVVIVTDQRPPKPPPSIPHW